MREVDEERILRELERLAAVRLEGKGLPDAADRTSTQKDRAAIPLRRDYSLNQVEYCRNLIFRRNFPIHKIFERSCELGVFRLTADQIAQIFGVRKHNRPFPPDRIAI